MEILNLALLEEFAFSSFSPLPLLMEALWRKVHCKTGSMERRSLTPMLNKV